jgi:hypothetical protein
MTPQGGILQGLEDAGAAWSATVALLTAIVYLTGYLVVRSHMTSWGIGIERTTFDFGHLFSGGAFFAFVLLNLAPLAILGLIGWWAADGLSRLLPIDDMAERAHAMRDVVLNHPALRPALALAALIFFVAGLAPALSLRNLLLYSAEKRDQVFNGNLALRHYRNVLSCRRAAIRHARLIVGGTALFLALALSAGVATTPIDRVATLILALTVAAQVYMLPVHYGTFYYEQDRPLLAGREAGRALSLLLYRGEKHVALATEPEPGRFCIAQRPLADLDTCEEIAIVRLGELLFGKDTLCTEKRSLFP